MSEYMIDRYEAFKERFGAAGVILGVIAIVLAIGGSALAASGLTAKQKKEVKAIAKSFQGTGPAGAPGTPGTNGTNGKDGAAGKDGTVGSPGANGKSVVTADYTGVNCATATEEGVSVEVEGSGTKKYVCDGEEGTAGTPGAPGSPWTAGGTLPVGSTETGEWAVAASEAGASKFAGVIPTDIVPISFPIPLAGGLDETHVHFEGQSGFASTCTGSNASPTAPSGSLCVYGVSGLTESSLLLIGKSATLEVGTDKSGAVLFFKVEGESARGAGTFAVTG